MEKTQFLRFKEDLKKEAQNQKELKNQRKTVNLKGERKVNPYTAAEEVINNRFFLDKMYVIYYIMKHRIEVTEENLDDVLWETYAKLHQKYAEARHIKIDGLDNRKQVDYYIDTPDGRDYTPDWAMSELKRRWKETLKKYEVAE